MNRVIITVKGLIETNEFDTISEAKCYIMEQIEDCANEIGEPVVVEIIGSGLSYEGAEYVVSRQNGVELFRASYYGE